MKNCVFNNKIWANRNIWTFALSKSGGHNPPPTPLSYASKAPTSSEMFRDIICKRSYLRKFSLDCVCFFFFFHYLFIYFTCIFHLAVKVLVWRVCDSGFFFSFYYILKDRAGSRRSGSPWFCFSFVFFFCIFISISKFGDSRYLVLNNSENFSNKYAIMHNSIGKLQNFVTSYQLPITGLHNKVREALLWFQLYIHI